MNPENEHQENLDSALKKIEALVVDWLEKRVARRDEALIGKAEKIINGGE